MTTSTGGTLTATVTVVAAPHFTGGMLSVAPLGTPLPAASTTALDPAFVNIGWVTGIEMTEDRGTTRVCNWGGTVVGSLQSSYSRSMTFDLVGSPARGTLVDTSSWVIDAPSVRVVVPAGRISYLDLRSSGTAVTVRAYPDASNHYEYRFWESA
jgi:hypothetical protein